MLAFIYGGSGSGKSTFAEALVSKLDSKKKIYLATMQVYDEEGRKKVERHQSMRLNKGFETIEAPRDLEKHFNFKGKKQENTTLLLECMSNLVANEMFRDSQIVDEKKVIEHVTVTVLGLRDIYENIVIVSNNIFEDGVDYDETTKSYMRAMAKINENIVKESDRAWEIVAGIPIKLK